MDALTRKIKELESGSWARDPITGKWVNLIPPRRLDGPDSQQPSASDLERVVRDNMQVLTSRLETMYSLPTSPMDMVRDRVYDDLYLQRNGIKKPRNLSKDERAAYDELLKEAKRLMDGVFFEAIDGTDGIHCELRRRFARFDRSKTGEDEMDTARSLGIDILKRLLYLRAAYDISQSSTDFSRRYTLQITTAVTELEKNLAGIRSYLADAIKETVSRYVPGHGGNAGDNTYGLAALGTSSPVSRNGGGRAFSFF